MHTSRRQFLIHALQAAGALSLSTATGAIARTALYQQSESAWGPLQEPDDNGIRLPSGFQSRRVAQSGHLVPGTHFIWHTFPDGGAIFPQLNGDYIYVSNSENVFPYGGASAIRFNADSDIIDAYRILRGSGRNCAGGPTPWGTWLSCEERDRGLVWECDVTGSHTQVHRALGRFQHEGVAVDPLLGDLYMTEDVGDGRLYKFVPEQFSGTAEDLKTGQLYVAHVDEIGNVNWLPVPNPTPKLLPWGNDTPTRYQVPESTAFDGGEGIWYHNGTIYFATKGDNVIWSYEIQSQFLTPIYQAGNFANPPLTGVDNVMVSERGDIYVAEDGGNMELVTILANGNIQPLLQVVDQDHSEITGPAIDPSGTRLYFSSQRGPGRGVLNNLGITYEITAPEPGFFFF